MRPRSPRRRRESPSRPQGSAWSQCLSGRAEGSSPVSGSSTAWCCGTSRGQSPEPAQRCSPRQQETDGQTRDGSDRSPRSRPEASLPGSGKGHQDQCSFDNIGHKYLLDSIGHFPAKELIKLWLKAGYVEHGKWHQTESVTPQGGVVTPPTILPNCR